MSVEEDIELRDLIQQSLEADGSLAKIRAQIRAYTFMALIEEEKIQAKQSHHNIKVKSHLEQPEGQLLFALVHEFLEYYNMHYTLKLYESETYQSAYYYNGRNKLLNDLHLNDNDLSMPLLTQLLRGCLKDVSYAPVVDTVDKNQKLGILNQTFNVNSDSKTTTPRSVASDGKEDTYEGTSSIAEDSFKEKSKVDTDRDQDFHETDTSNSGINGISSLNKLEIASTAIDVERDKERSEKSSRSDKFKSKSPRAALSEIGTLMQTNKPRDFVLPSLFTSNQEFDDNLDNYEEDFMSTSEAELKEGEESALHTPRSLNSLNFDKMLKSPVSPRKENDVSLNESIASSINSDDFELNSTVDEILKSNTD